MATHSMKYQCSFRVGTSHFILDLNAPLASFWSDVVVCFGPAPVQFTGLFAGLQYSGRDVGVLKGLQGKCKFLLCADADDAGLEVVFQVQLRDLGVRKVTLTEPVVPPKSQPFVSAFVQTALDFLNFAKYSQVVFSTDDKALYEQIFNVLSAQGKPAYEEGNGVVNDEVLLRTLVSSLSCKFCNRLSYSAKVTQCCRRLLCENCAKEGRPCCQVPPSLLLATCSHKLLSTVQLQCECGKQVVWQDSEHHSLRCPATGAVCPLCRLHFSRSDYLLHLTQVHPNDLLASNASVSSSKETLLYQQNISPPSVSTTWSCPNCSNINLSSQATCLRCHFSRS